MVEKLIQEKNLTTKEFLTPLQNNLVKSLQRTGPTTRRDLVRLLNTPRTTIYDNLLKLHKRKIIEKITRNNGKRGRPLVFWKMKE